MNKPSVYEVKIRIVRYDEFAGHMHQQIHDMVSDE